MNVWTLNRENRITNYAEIWRKCWSIKMLPTDFMAFSFNMLNKELSLHIKKLIVRFIWILMIFYPLLNLFGLSPKTILRFRFQALSHSGHSFMIENFVWIVKKSRVSSWIVACLRNFWQSENNYEVWKGPKGSQVST